MWLSLFFSDCALLPGSMFFLVRFEGVAGFSSPELSESIDASVIVSLKERNTNKYACKTSLILYCVPLSFCYAHPLWMPRVLE